MDWKRNTFNKYGLDTVTSFVETLTGGEQAVVCNYNSTFSGFIISQRIANRCSYSLGFEGKVLVANNHRCEGKTVKFLV